MRKGETIEQWERRVKFEGSLLGRIRKLNAELRAEIQVKKQSKSLRPSDIQPNKGGEKSGGLMML